MGLVETDLAALEVSLDGPGWKVGTGPQWDEGIGGTRERVLRQCLGEGVCPPGEQSAMLNQRGSFSFTPMVPGGTGAFSLLRKDQCAYPSSL